MSSLNPKNRGLGRGLDALFETNDAAQPNQTEELESSVSETPLDQQNPMESHRILENTDGISSDRKTIGIEQIEANPDQPRKIFDTEAIEGLVNSLKTYGILQPLLVRPKKEGEGYQIIAGERRWRAAQLAQIHEVPVVIRDMDDSEALQIGLVENLQREDLNPIEEALGYQNLMEEFGHTQKAVSELVGKSRSQVTNMMRLLSLPTAVQNMLEHGEITKGHARALIGKDNAETLAKQIISKNLSVREIEDLLSTTSKPTKEVSFNASSQPKDSDTIALEREISDHLGMDVYINLEGHKNKGNVKISFKSLEQLDFLLHKLKEN